MAKSTAPTSTIELTDLSLGEIAALVVLAGPLLGSLSLVITGWRRTAVGWALSHQLLVPNPWLAIPGLGGPGLDLDRALIFGGLCGLALFLLIHTVQKRWTDGAVARPSRTGTAEGL